MEHTRLDNPGWLCCDLAGHVPEVCALYTSAGHVPETAYHTLRSLVPALVVLACKPGSTWGLQTASGKGNPE